MITPEDLAYAQELLKQGRVPPDQLEKILASLASSADVRLKDLFPEGSASPATFDKTRMAGDAIVGEAGPAEKAFARYQIIEEVARGGMGIVYKALEPGLNRHVALKVMLAGDAASDEQVQRFLREARAAAGLSHPNIIPVYEVGQHDGRHFFAMEFVDGIALDTLLKREGALPPRLAVRIARDTARALQFAHERGIVHRDVKPGNILLEGALRDASQDGASGRRRAFRVLLGDFGLAKDTASTQGLTLSGNLLGTPSYMSPEQAAGKASSVDSRSDIYALGAVLHEMVSGKPPFTAASLGDLLLLIQGGEAPPLRRARPGTHRDVEVMVQKAMAREPERRYRTAGEFADDLDRWLSGDAILAEGPSALYRFARQVRRRAAAFVAGAAVLAAGAGAVGYLGWKSVSERRATSERATAEAAGRLSTARAEVESARALIASKDFTSAQVKLDTALRLVPALPEALEASALRRLRQGLHEIERQTTGDEKNWEAARAVLGTMGEFRDDPEVRKAARRVAGTCVFSAAAAGMEVDLGEAEPGIHWDEETFPALAAAREAGLCRPLGRSPIAPRDLPMGNYIVVFSRNGVVERVVSHRLLRNEEVAFDHRVLRVGPDEEFRSVSEAVQAAKPGSVVEIATPTAVTLGVPIGPGVLVRPAPGLARVRLDCGGAGFSSAGAAHGAALRDLDLVRAYYAAGDVFRPSIVRCTFRDGAVDCALNFHHADEFVIRDVVTRNEGRGQGFAADGSASGIVFGLDVEGCEWTGASVGGEVLFVRCRFAGCSRCGLYVANGRVEVRESVFLDNPEWGLLSEGRTELSVADCLFTGNGTRPRTAFPGPLCVQATAGVVEHNTVVGGVMCGISISGGPLVRGNLVTGVTALTGSRESRPGRAYLVSPGGERTPSFEDNLAWDCEWFGSVGQASCRTPEEFASAPLKSGEPRGPLSVRGIVADPRLKADHTLPPDSPARGACADGSDLGVRWDRLDSAGLESGAWLVRENGRRYLARAKEALSGGDRDRAKTLARRARVCLPAGGEGLEDLERALR